MPEQELTAIEGVQIFAADPSVRFSNSRSIDDLNRFFEAAGLGVAWSPVLIQPKCGFSIGDKFQKGRRESAKNVEWFRRLFSLVRGASAALGRCRKIHRLYLRLNAKVGIAHILQDHSLGVKI